MCHWHFVLLTSEQMRYEAASSVQLSECQVVHVQRAGNHAQGNPVGHEVCGIPEPDNH